VRYERGGDSFPHACLWIIDPIVALTLKNPSHTSPRDAGFSAVGLDRGPVRTNSTNELPTQGCDQSVTGRTPLRAEPSGRGVGPQPPWDLHASGCFLRGGGFIWRLPSPAAGPAPARHWSVPRRLGGPCAPRARRSTPATRAASRRPPG